MAGETTSAILSPIMAFKLQRKVLENLRSAYTYANRAFAEPGQFMPGADIIKWASVPDLAADTTPLTEGTPPTAVALSVNAVSLDSAQYGGLVKITDLAKLKSPVDLVNIASERLSDKVEKTVDQLVRDEVAAGGTQVFSDATDTVRSGIASTAVVTAAVLRRLNGKMKKANIAPFADRFYRLIVSPEVEFDIRNDTATGGFIDVHKYTTPETIIRGEAGRMEGFRIIVADTAPTVSSTTTVHLSLALGKLPGWGWGDMQTLRTYHTAPGGQSDPLHQNEYVGYKLAFGTAVLDNARYMRLESAATAL